MQFVYTFLTMIMAVSGAFASEIPTQISGKVDIVQDGDSIIIHNNTIRLLGIDAPEIDQWCHNGNRGWPCGKSSAKRLHELVKGRDVRCTIFGQDRYKRLLGTCFIFADEGVIDINEAMVASGWAYVYRTSHGNVKEKEYLAKEKAAKLMKAGFWDSKITPPWEWRKQKREKNKKN